MISDRWRRIEELFHAARDLPADRRAAFLEKEAGGDAGLKSEIESLLAEAWSHDSFFDKPGPIESLTGPSAAVSGQPMLGIGSVLGPYQITGFIGAGGMGQVYRAHDTRLLRSVAIKVLSPGQDARRFEHEARTLAALSHANVVPVFDVGHDDSIDGGLDYLVEELVEGESLRDLLLRGPLTLARFHRLAAQIADGLAAAHRAGIIHRDLKPGNVMISREDCARILDFGLAIRYCAPADQTSTVTLHTGVAAGTAAYMSPEQVRGNVIDTRSDIFSFGAVLYEMVSGQRPFARDSLTATLSAVLEASPPPVDQIAAGVPRDLAGLIEKCLEKDLNSRFQTMEEVKTALLETGEGRAPVPAAGRRAFAVWSAGVLALLSLSSWWLYSHRARAFTNKDSVILADVANSTGEAVFDHALKQGLAVQLSQSPLLNILSEQRVRATLQEMTRPPDEPLTASAAHEVCVRAGGRAYISGSISSLGSHYVLGLNATDCATGDVLAREQAEAPSKEQVLTALGGAAQRVRQKLGESLSSIQRFDVPLAQATTPSLDALKAYSVALNKFSAGQSADAVPLFRQAIELDSRFALAYADLGRAYENVGQGGRMQEALRRAFALRGRTSERERYNISAAYYQFVTFQPDETIRTCELWLQNYPRDFVPRRILGYEHAVLGRIEQSVDEFRLAKELDPAQNHPYAGLILDYMNLGRRADADAISGEARKRSLSLVGQTVGLPLTDRDYYLLAFFEDDAEKMKAFEGYAPFEQARTAAYFGHFGRALEVLRRMERSAIGAGNNAAAMGMKAQAALLRELFGDPAGARRDAADAMRLGKQLPRADASGGGAAATFISLAMAADAASAAKIADDLVRESEPGSLTERITAPIIRAVAELKRGNAEGAIELLAPMTQYERGWADHYISAYVRGQAYLAAHRGEAAAEFQKIIDHRGAVLNSPIGSLAHLGLARSYLLAGNAAGAGAAYRDFLALWKDADPDVPILKQARTEYAGLKEGAGRR